MDQVYAVSTHQLSDLGVIMLDHSVKQQSSHVHIHPWKFAAGTEMIWIAMEQKNNHLTRYLDLEGSSKAQI